MKPLSTDSYIKFLERCLMVTLCLFVISLLGNITLAILSYGRNGQSQAQYYYKCRPIHDTLVRDIQIHAFSDPFPERRQYPLGDTVVTKEGDSLIVLVPVTIHQ